MEFKCFFQKCLDITKVTRQFRFGTEIVCNGLIIFINLGYGM